MSEVRHSTERKLPKEQQKLIRSARLVLESREAVHNGPYYSSRPTTKGEKAQRFIGALLGRKREQQSIGDDIFETPETETTTKTVGLKGLGGWGDGLYLKQTTVRNLDNGTTSESLVMYTTHIKNDRPSATDYGAWYEDVTWEQELLVPINDPKEILRLQGEIHEAVERFAPER